MQVLASQLVIRLDNEEVELKTDLQVTGVCISKENIAVWSSKTMAVYQLIPLNSLNVIGN